MMDMVTGLFPDPVQHFIVALALLAGAFLLLGMLQLILFALSSILLSRGEGRPKAPPDLAVFPLAVALGVGSFVLSAPKAGAQDVPTIEARLTRVFSSDSLKIGSASPSPDGRWIAFDGFRDGIGDIFVVSAQGGDPIRLTNGRHLNQIPQWFPSGDRIVFLSDQVAEGQGLLLYVMSIPIDPETGRATGPARQVSLEPAREPAISPDGRWIAYGTYIMQGLLRVIPSEGGTARTLFDPSETTGSPGVPGWSSDSKSVYFRSRGSDPEGTRLMRVSVEGGEAEVVSSIRGAVRAIAPDARYLVRQMDGGPGKSPVLELLSRDGQVLGQVPLHRNMDSGSPVGFLLDGRGSTAVVRDVVAPIFVAPVPVGSPRRISDGRTNETPLGWTPDNQEIFYRTTVDGREAVLLAPVAGGPTLEIPLPEEAGGPIAPSADGKYLAYALGSGADTGRTVMVRRISDGETRVLTQAFLRGLDPVGQGRQVLGPGGSPSDGDEFLFLERHGDRVELRASPPEGPSRVVRSVAPGPGPGERYSLAVHGDWVAYPESSGESESTLFLSAGEGEPARALATVSGLLEGVCWSHDRRWIVAGLSVPQGQSFKFDLLLVGVTPEGTLASEPRILEAGMWVPLGGVQWLPDNQTIALLGMVMATGVATHLWLIPIREGESAVPVTLGEAAPTWSASLSPSGRHVAFSEEVLRGSSIWMVDYEEFLREKGLVGRYPEVTPSSIYSFSASLRGF